MLQACFGGDGRDGKPALECVCLPGMPSGFQISRHQRRAQRLLPGLSSGAANPRSSQPKRPAAWRCFATKRQAGKSQETPQAQPSKRQPFMGNGKQPQAGAQRPTQKKATDFHHPRNSRHTCPICMAVPNGAANQNNPKRKISPSTTYRDRQPCAHNTNTGSPRGARQSADPNHPAIYLRSGRACRQIFVGPIR